MPYIPDESLGVGTVHGGEDDELDQLEGGLGALRRGYSADVAAEEFLDSSRRQGVPSEVLEDLSEDLYGAACVVAVKVGDLAGVGGARCVGARGGPLGSAEDGCVGAR